jgi:hypothetical protein
MKCNVSQKIPIYCVEKIQKIIWNYLKLEMSYPEYKLVFFGRDLDWETRKLNFRS